jgi:O-antigen/teichoic acid export membrane protein
VSGATWTLIGFGGGTVIRTIGNMTLTRFVAPEAFGIMALVNVTIQGLQMMSDVGVGTAIVQHKRGSEDTFLRTAWTLGIIRSVLIALVGCLLALPIARMYDNAVLAPLIIVSSLSTLLNGTMSTSLFIASRELKIHRVVAIELITSIVTTMTMILAAVCYPVISSAVLGLATLAWMPGAIARFVARNLTNPVWALLIGTFCGLVIRWVLSYTIVPSIRHRLCWNKECRTELIRYGRWIVLSTLLTFLTNQLDRFIVPKLLNNLTLFGLYSIALNFASMPMDILQRLGSQVLFPVYSTLARQNRFTGDTYARVSFIILTLGALSVSGLVAIAPGFIRTFFRAEYHDVAIILQVFALVVWLRVLQYNSSSALLAMGDTKIQASSNMVKLVGLAVFVAAGFYAGSALSDHRLAGLFGAIAGIALAELAKYGALAYAWARSDWSKLKPDVKATLELSVVCSLVVAGHFLTRSLPAWLDMLLSGLIVTLMYSVVMARALVMVAPHLPMKLPGPLARLVQTLSRFERKPKTAGGVA